MALLGRMASTTAAAVRQEQLGGSARELAFRPSGGSWGHARCASREEIFVPTFDVAASSDPASPAGPERLKHLAVVKKLNAGTLREIQMEDVEELYEHLDEDESGTLEFSEIATLFQTVLDPPCTESETRILWQLTDQSSDGTVSLEELYRAIVSDAFIEHYGQLQRAARARLRLLKSMGHAEVTRSFFVERVQWRMRRDDAFLSLPFYILFLFVFVSTATAHLEVFRRQRLQGAIERYLQKDVGDYAGPLHGRDIRDEVEMMQWVAISGLPAILGSCNNSMCRIVNSTLIGDVRLRRLSEDADEQSAWLLNSDEARGHLEVNPGDYLGASIARLNALWQGGWHLGANGLHLVFISYAETPEYFAITEAGIHLEGTGQLIPTVISRAAVAEPASKGILLALDALYVCLVLYPLIKEIKDIIAVVQVVGFTRAFKHYWGFWRLIDWFGIMMGISNCGIWAGVCLATRSDAIKNVLYDDGFGTVILNPYVMQMDTEAIEKCEKSLRAVVSLIFMLQLFMGINVVSVLMRLIKGFQANPRLQVVTKTLVRGATDLCHFLVVFWCIFTGFSTSGYILFGDSLIEFASFERSLNTAYATLLGEFKWYQRYSRSDRGMRSELPQWVLALWFWLWCLFVVLTMLNMLLTIVLDHYFEIMTQLRKRDRRKEGDAPALWTQCRQFMVEAWERAGHITMLSLYNRLMDTRVACHPQEIVTFESLIAAFPDMKPEQASYLIDWLRSDANYKVQRNKDFESIARLKELSSLLHSMADQVRVVYLQESLTADRLHIVEKTVAECDLWLQSVEDTVRDSTTKFQVNPGGPERSAFSPTGAFSPPSAFSPAARAAHAQPCNVDGKVDRL